MALLTERTMEWAAARAPDRIVAVGILGVRPLRYLSQAAPPAAPAIEGLRVVAVGSNETPMFHAETGLYGFLRLPPGPCRIEITDGAARLLPWAVMAAAPDRRPIRAALERGVAPPALPRPALIDVPMRPAPGAPLPPGLTAIWGVVREAASGAPVPLARIACSTVGGALVVTFAAADGGFLIALPAERTDPFTPRLVFDRALVMHAPRAPLAAALRAAARYVAAIPADLDTIDPDAAAAPFVRRDFQLRPASGPVVPGPAPVLSVRAAERSRWDIELLP